MGLSSISIRRPVLSIVMSLVIIIFGVVGFTSLGIREFPNVDPPVVNVSTTYVGANADVIESQITERLEESINGIAGIRVLRSTSRDGRSSISVEFNLGEDMEAATNDVRDRVSRAMWMLPPDINSPIVAKADADADAIMFVNIKSNRRSLLELTDIADRVFKERLQTIPGVSMAQIWGERRYAMRIYIDADRLSAYGVTPVDIRNALLRENVELPTGSLEGQATELSVRTAGRLTTEEEFNSLIIKEDGGNIVRIRDIGIARLAPENEKTILRRDGVPSAGVALIAQPGVNQLTIAEEFYRRVEEIKTDLPEDLIVEYGFDDTRFVVRSIAEVKETVALAFLLVVIIIFVFLRNWRTTLIPSLAIPISLIGAFFVMWVFGFSINVLTLLAVVLSIALVVDDAIIVMENIYTKIEKGIPPKQAAVEGAAEIFFAVVSTTVVLIAVFLPIIFLQGMTGRLFREFAVVIAGAVTISSFVALTLSPMLCSKILKRNEKQNWLFRKTEKWFILLIEGYSSSLKQFMKKPVWAAIILVVAAGVTYLCFTNLKSELAPQEDRDTVSLSVTAQEGYSFEKMDAFMFDLFALVREVIDEDELESIIMNTAPGWGAGGSNSGNMRIMLKPASERRQQGGRSQQEIADALTREVRILSAARVMVRQPATIRVGGGGGGGGGNAVQFVIQAQNLDKLREFLPIFMDEARKSPKLAFVDANLRFNKPEVKIEINRDKAKTLQVSVQDIAQTLQLGLSGARYGFFVMNGKQYQVIGQFDRVNRNKPLDIRSIYVRNSQGLLIQMDNLINMVEQANPPQLYRFNRFVSATITAQMAPGVTLGEAVDELQGIAKATLDDTFRTELTGQAREMRDSSGSIMYAFILALILVYLTLAAQFESFRDPIIILVPMLFALAGALFSLWYFKETWNIFSQIGTIMLLGLVTKNGILIVEFANQKKAKGMSVLQAVQESAQQRFRPILMTSLSTIFGILPIALALGAGSESRVSMGIAVVGGMALATWLTLYVIPVVYMWLSDKRTGISG
ncbi:MAG: efflux RND transporter permease subunit [Bacteroidales bacterium]|nr:efflux RND transporter permease subunit [Bacteroidales bacterium]